MANKEGPTPQTRAIVPTGGIEPHGLTATQKALIGAALSVGGMTLGFFLRTEAGKALSKKLLAHAAGMAEQAVHAATPIVGATAETVVRFGGSILTTALEAHDALGSLTEEQHPAPDMQEEHDALLQHQSRRVVNAGPTPTS